MYSVGSGPVGGETVTPKMRGKVGGARGDRPASRGRGRGGWESDAEGGEEDGGWGRNAFSDGEGEGGGKETGWWPFITKSRVKRAEEGVDEEGEGRLGKGVLGLVVLGVCADDDMLQEGSTYEPVVQFDSCIRLWKRLCIGL